MKPSPAVNGRRSLDIICVTCCFQPRSAVKPPMTHMQPKVKLMANFEGDRMMVGKNIVKDSSRKTPPAAKKLKKYASCCPEGMLHGKERSDRPAHASPMQAWSNKWN